MRMVQKLTPVSFVGWVKIHGDRVTALKSLNSNKEPLYQSNAYAYILCPFQTHKSCYMYVEYLYHIKCVDYIHLHS